MRWDSKWWQQYFVVFEQPPSGDRFLSAAGVHTERSSQKSSSHTAGFVVVRSIIFSVKIVNDRSRLRQQLLSAIVLYPF